MLDEIVRSLGVYRLYESRLNSQIRTEGGQVDELRSVAPVLEDVFIALSESSYE